MTPTVQTKQSRLKAANASVKALDGRIAELETRLVTLRKRKVDAVAHRDWIAAMPEPVAEPVVTSTPQADAKPVTK